MPKLTITIELSSTLELEALESALDMFVECEGSRIADFKKSKERIDKREELALVAGTNLLARVRGTTER